MQGQIGRFSSYRFGEGRTAIDQAVKFTCPPDVVEQVREFLKTNIRTIDIPTTGRVNISHGSYGKYTRYNVTQHDYAGGGPGEGGGWSYIEVLEIKDPPDGRWGIVINESTSHHGSGFTEWETLEDARIAFSKYWGDHHSVEKFAKLKGFKRSVACGALTPWFYAIGDEQLIGDYTFPDGLQDDPVYRFGRQFVVFGEDGIPSVKTCMGTRFFIRKDTYPSYKERQCRIVYWDDGSIWDESGYHSWWSCRYGSPRPVEEGELWVAEAVQQFRQLLAGKSKEFSVHFTDGNKFVGKVVRHKNKVQCAEGSYLLVVHLKGEKKHVEGWVYDFKPTPEAPDIVQFVTQRYAQKGKEVERIEIKKSKTEKGGKKWSGVFLHSPR